MKATILNVGRVLICGAILQGAACSGPRAVERPTAVSPAMLFGGDHTTHLATQLGRSPWPATFGQVTGAEDTHFVEYYRDYFGGNADLERSNPQRQFRSYRVGSKHR